MQNARIKCLPLRLLGTELFTSLIFVVLACADIRQNQIWHLDQSVFRIVNGPKVFIQCIIDNFSRYVLAWQVTGTYGGASTKALIEKALAVAKAICPKEFVPNLWVDGGSENINQNVDLLISSGQIIRTIAQIDIEFSNSIVESLFRSIKHRRLFLLSLTSPEEVRHAVDEYLSDHNNVILHYALKGGIPVEACSGSWTTESKTLLAEVCASAKTARVEFNRSRGCGLCPF